MLAPFIKHSGLRVPRDTYGKMICLNFTRKTRHTKPRPLPLISLYIREGPGSIAGLSNVGFVADLTLRRVYFPLRRISPLIIIPRVLYMHILPIHRH